MKNKSLTQTINESLNGSEEYPITLKIVGKKNLSSFKNELRVNKIKFTFDNQITFRLEDTPKSRMAIRLAKERFGMHNVTILAESLDRVIYDLDQYAKSLYGDAFAETVNDGAQSHGIFEIPNKKIVIDQIKNYVQQHFEATSFRVVKGRPGMVSIRFKINGKTVKN